MSAGWTLHDLLAPWGGGDHRPLADLTLDSRDVTPGSLFLALAGSSAHGLDHLDQALANGASAVVWEPAVGRDAATVAAACEAAGAVAVPVEGLAAMVGPLAARFFGEPSRALTLVGVTGTDGKTSVTQFIGQALETAAGGCGVIGTLGWGRPGAMAPTRHTTPDAVTLQRWLAALRADGVAAVAMEVSSHALDQGRVAGLEFDAAVLTNLGHDHLDYHGTEAAYAAAKQRLFRHGVPRPVLNLDDAFGRSLAADLADRAPVGYSVDGAAGAALRCVHIEPEPGALRLALSADGRRAAVCVPLIGRFNAANTLATFGVMRALGVAFDEALSRIAALRPVPGRMECFRTAGRPAVLVDYAHTPGALREALAAARAHFDGAVWVVFGCGGDRDRGKRPLMGAIARAGADHVVLTNDNPRSEDPERIIAEIRGGIGTGEPVHVITDRAAAIAAALEQAAPEDVVLVAGKGHEDYQIIGDQRIAFSDRACVEALLREAG